jgi:hypothetical protein
MSLLHPFRTTQGSTGRLVYALAAAIAACIAADSQPAGATLIEVDLLAAGDRLITRDTNTGLDWLDWTATSNLSVSQILGGSGGWLSLGFRYATTSEVCGLVTSYAISATCPGGANAIGGTALIPDLGQTLLADLSSRSRAYFDDDSLADNKAGFVELHHDSTTGDLSQLVQLNAVSTSSAQVDVGNALVRALPEPSTASLLELSILMTMLVRPSERGRST